MKAQLAAPMDGWKSFTTALGVLFAAKMFLGMSLELFARCLALNSKMPKRIRFQLKEVGRWEISPQGLGQFGLTIFGAKKRRKSSPTVFQRNTMI